MTAGQGPGPYGPPAGQGDAPKQSDPQGWGAPQGQPPYGQPPQGQPPYGQPSGGPAPVPPPDGAGGGLSFDPKKLSMADYVIAGGAVLFFVLALLPWWSYGDDAAGTL